MIRPTRLEIDIATGIQKEIELTDEEIAQLEQSKIEYEAAEAARLAEEASKIEAKASAQAKLSALGLTPEEIAALSN